MAAPAARAEITVTHLRIMLSCPAFAAAMAFMPAPASAGPVGQLYCDVSDGAGLVVTSRRTLNCEYTPADGAPHQRYIGTIDRYDLDIGPKAPGLGKLAWDVASPGGAVGPGALAGGYARATASAKVGVEADALVGSANGGVQLQPLPVDVPSGLNLAVGVGALSLEHAP